MPEPFIPAPPAEPTEGRLYPWLQYWRTQRGLYAGTSLGNTPDGRSPAGVFDAEVAAADAINRAFERAAFLRAQTVREVIDKLEMLREAVQMSAASDCHDVLVMLASIEADLEGLTGAAASNQQTPPAGLVTP